MHCRESQLGRLERLERFVRITKCLSAVSLALVAGLFIFGRYVSASAREGKILRVRGIVIEDSAGRPRLLLGAPISDQGGKRQVEVTGLVLLSEDGIVRLAIGTANYDQINGTLQHRIANGVGFLLNDSKGNERGHGFLESGRVTLGLDRAHGEEGAFLTVDDEDEFAGLLVKNLHTCNVTSLGNSKSNGTRLLLRDEACNDRVLLGMKDALPPKLEVRDSDEKLVFDAFAKSGK